MDRYYTQTLGAPVITASGTTVSRIVEIVIDPENGKVVGFLLGHRGEYVLAPADIIFWDDGIFVQDEDDILETQEIIKVQEVLKKNLPIFGAKVFTKKGVYIGKVYDIGIDQKFFVMTTIAVAKNILGLFPYDEKILPQNHILEVKPDRIIVKDIDAKVRNKAKLPEVAPNQAAS